MKIVKILIGIAMILPVFAIPRLIGEMTLRGYEPWEAICLALGMTLPFVLLFFIAYFFVDKSTSRTSR